METENINNKLVVGIIVVLLLGSAVYLLDKKNTTQVLVSPQPSPTAAMQMNMTQQGSITSTPAISPAIKNVVAIRNYMFSPLTITVKVGDAITWTNKDSIGHSATADDNSFDTGVLAQGQSKSITFSKAGTYTYHCSVHPNMKATIIVQ